ncbi:hypothetical protein [Streptomyces sp. SID161]|uniref:hypothetical protein n=1 Tax=Streptomyces sp. SID161 TaxID=2690251 RepID=UPI00136E1F50|nr:hypothetical protein [Streptomyces sp. SID161]MYW46385.1 hypothetical protein [Streptomyces sp. SID161]
MDQQQLAYRMFAERAGRDFLTGLHALPEFKPRPGVDLGRLRISVTLLGDGDPHLGFADMDPVNLGDLASIAVRRAEGLRTKHAQTTRPTLRLIGGTA